MKAVILAAGQGLRLRQHHRLPKGLLQIGDKPIIMESIAALNANGIEDILLVTGYGAQHYDNLAKQTGLFSTIFNDQFEQSGSLYSLSCAREWLDDDFVLLESDLIYQTHAIAHLLASSASNCVLVSGQTNAGDEVYVQAHQQRLCKMSKRAHELDRNAIVGEFVGINKLSYVAYQKLLDLLLQNPSLLSAGNYEEEGLVLLAQHEAVVCELLTDLLWSEIDTLEHLNRAKQLHAAIHSTAPVTNHQTKRKVLLNPGPVTTSAAVKQALIVPDICHREKAFANTIQSIRQDLLKVINAKDDFTCILFSASGTGAIEACLSSIVAQNKKALILNNGSYGQRMLDIARRYKINTVELSCPFDQAVPIDALEKMLKEDTSIEYVAIVHHETSSGILNPLRHIGDICHRLGRYFIVDAMSSYAGAPLDATDDHIDFLMASSNKCLHGMPGVAFVIAKVESLLATEGQARSYYFDLHQQYRSLNKEGVFAFTPPVQVLYSLQQALNELQAETVAGRIARYHQRYDQMMAGLVALGFACVTPAAWQSKLLATVRFPNERVDFAHFHDYLYAKGFTVYPKKLDIANTFRLACIGELYQHDIDCFLQEVQHYMSTIERQSVVINED